MTLKQAQAIQREKETQVIIKLIGFSSIVLVASFLLLYYTKMLEISSIFYLIPFAMEGIVIKKTGASTFFTPRIFVGKVIKIDIYGVSEARVKGAGKGHGSNYNRFLEAELIARNEKGKTVLRKLYNGDITARLSEGDEIAFLRFIDEPIVIKGRYWK